MSHDLTGAEQQERARRTRTRTTRIASTLYRAALEGVDVGDLLAAACRTAAARLDGTTPPGWDGPADGLDALLAGRSGSWEAEHVRGLAGGWEHDR